MSEDQILCACSAYEEKYYFNPRYSTLPAQVQEELRVLSVLFTEDVGGIFTISFDEDGTIYFSTSAAENDFFYDEIGSELKIKKYQDEYKELMIELEQYYRQFIMGQ